MFIGEAKKFGLHMNEEKAKFKEINRIQSIIFSKQMSWNNNIISELIHTSNNKEKEEEMQNRLVSARIFYQRPYIEVDCAS